MCEKSSTPPDALQDMRRRLKDCLPTLETEYQVKSLGIFGSYVRGEARSNSDIDLLVEYWQAPTLFQFVRLERRLTLLLGVKVDLVMRSALKPEIGKHILGEVVPV